MRYSIGQAAECTGVSVRTLRHYDKIGLLKPSEVSPAGYRYYDAAAMETLQQILFYRELGFPLAEIRQILCAPDHDKSQALQRHRKLLLMKRRQLDDMLRLVDETLGGITMQEQTISSHRADLEAVKKAYAREARERWGGTAAYQAFQAGHSGDTAEQERQLGHGLLEIFRAFHDCGAPEGPAAQALVERLQEYITRCYYPCSRDILASLGRLYTEDCRFRQTLEQCGPGTAERVGRAIAAYCKE